MEHKVPDETVESIVHLINHHFKLDVGVDSENIPYVKQAHIKGSLPDFINGILSVIESSETDGKLNYYFDNEIDFDTPEEYHRY